MRVSTCPRNVDTLPEGDIRASLTEGGGTRSVTEGENTVRRSLFVYCHAMHILIFVKI